VSGDRTRRAVLLAAALTLGCGLTVSTRPVLVRGSAPGVDLGQLRRLRRVQVRMDAYTDPTPMALRGTTASEYEGAIIAPDLAARVAAGLRKLGVDVAECPPYEGAVEVTVGPVAFVSYVDYTAGSLRLAARDAAGAPLGSFEISGDARNTSPRDLVRWALGVLDGSVRPDAPQPVAPTRRR